MNRRKFGLMAASSAGALAAGMDFTNPARAAASADQIAMLKTTLTPFGSERAGNADGSIPAWTGGATGAPSGWTPGTPIPDAFASESPVVTINASNMDQHKDRLSDGVMLMMQKYGYSIDVYPSHRTAAAPQWVYDNIATNAANAAPVTGGARLGFSGGYGGIPFPFLNQSDPLEAGAEAIWNHQTRWVGSHYIAKNYANYSVSGGRLTLVSQYEAYSRYRYYDPSGNASSFKGFYGDTYVLGLAPPSNTGSQFLVYAPTNPLAIPGEGWQYLSGQGRVRKVPEIQYDIPEAQVNGLINYDEVFLFFGALDRFDWKLIGKKEMYIPYNCNAICQLDEADYGPHFLNPAKTRWELHRVWEVEATLHPGERNVAPHRRLYLDEDTWLVGLVDEWDAQGNFWKAGMNLPISRPDLPGTIAFGFVFYNVQEDGYVVQNVFANGTPMSQRILDLTTVPQESVFNPQTMAANSEY